MAPLPGHSQAVLPNSHTLVLEKIDRHDKGLEILVTTRYRKVTLKQDQRAGEKMFVDWAGPTVPIRDGRPGGTESAALFVAVLGAGTHTFAYAARGRHLANWIECRTRAFEFTGGTPKLFVPDNPRTGVDHACRYEPDLNRTYHEMAEYYGTAIMPRRPYKLREKAKVDNSVLLVERRITGGVAPPPVCLARGAE